jgi:5-methyltetrahydropteroyltriglutamate--homocysteine methyltransferase
MELLLSNHGSYPRIGDDPGGQLLRRAIAQREKGEKTDADLRAAEDQMAARALAEQVEAGVDLVTDGLIRWYDPVSHLAGKLAGIKINGLLRFFDTNFYFRQPIVGGKIKREKSLVVEEFLFAKAKSPRPVKTVLTGPYTLARLSIGQNEETGKLENLLASYTQALAEEVGALADAGATLIQVDEPAILKHPEDFSRFEASIGALAASKGSARLGLAFYFGDVAPLYRKIQGLPVDFLCLDFTYSPILPEIVATEGSSKTLALGLLDGRNTRLEDPNALARQLEHMTSRLKADIAYLTSSCGLEYLPRDRAQLKLRHLTTVKKTFLGRAA